MLEPAAVLEPDSLVIGVPPASRWVADLLTEGDAPARLEAAVREVLGRRVVVRLDRGHSSPQPDESSPPTLNKPSARARHEQIDADPFVQEVVKLFDARTIRLVPDDEADLG